MSFVSADGWQGGSGVTLTAPSAPFVAVPGNSLYVFLSNYTTDGAKLITGVSDAAENDYVRVGSRLGGDANHLTECWVCDACKGHATMQVSATYDGTANFVTMIVAQYSGMANPSFDAEGAGVVGARSSLPTTDPVTAGNPNALLLGFFLEWASTFRPADAPPCVERTGLVAAALIERVVADPGSYALQATSEFDCQVFTRAFAFKTGGAPRPLHNSMRVLRGRRP